MFPEWVEALLKRAGKTLNWSVSEMSDSKVNQGFTGDEAPAVPYSSGPADFPSAAQAGTPTYLTSGMPIGEAPAAPPSYDQATATTHPQSYW